MPKLVVLLRGNGSAADRRRTIDALKQHTSDLGVCLLASGAANAEPKIETVVTHDHSVLIFVSEAENGTLADQLAWELVQRASDADVVLVELGTAVGPEWHELLRRAAYEDAIIATSSAVPDELLALDRRSRTRPDRASDRAVPGAALGEPLWCCVYIRRDALNIAMGSRLLADDRLNAPSPSLEDAVLVPGLVHVLAATVVERAPGRPRLARASTLTPAVRRAVAEIEATLGPLRVTVDLRCCASPMSGTQVHALNLVASLAKRDELRLSVVVPPYVDESVQPHLDALPTSVTRHIEGQRIGPMPQVFHRPYQVLAESEVAEVVTSGARLVVTHQDMILDRTPAYFASPDHWRRHVATTALTLVAADEVVFFSEHARQEALRDGLIDRFKTSVVPPGTDHVAMGDEVMPSTLTGRLAPEGPRFVFVVGNSYSHKNRLFALRVSEELRRVHGWDGAIVFAGTAAGNGSSGNDESAFLRNHDELSARFVDLPRVTDAELRWLYNHAALVLFPTLYEGFGLVPFEAAASGTACVYSSRSSVAEYLPPEGALLDVGDVAASARRVHDVLVSDEASTAIVRAIRFAGSRLTWDATAGSYVDIYLRSMTRPVGLSLVAGQELIVGATSRMATSETERRVLVALRRSAAVRLVARAVISAATVVRSAGRRLSRAS